MCNLYRMRKSVAEIANLFDAAQGNAFEWAENIYPRMEAPVIVSAHGERRLGPMHWGFPLEVQGKTKMITKHVTNARNLDSPMWRGSLAAHRCLVPFTSFAEPKAGKDGEGRPAQYWFTIEDQEIAAFAGLWRKTESGPVFAFCTTEPNALTAPLHPKAMPVVLLAEDHERWLSGTAEEARALQASYPSQLMRVTATN
ncbi:SOS response-associated peptidase [Croceicoccus bisphenolivorans]|uniref:SOS response-associated peptidase n=1 Tax=Croceicoccus bisphenolivorans TaxID=1783232 RepID=UPI00082B79AF|nr:SOS response-associated peptidase family protein [Croceicoccus bisphenolivorans]